MKIAFIRLTIIIFCIGGLTHCSSSKGIRTQLNVSAARYLNPDINGQTSPVVLSVYELKAPYAFKAASFNQLNNNAAAVLGTNLIDKQTIEVRPESQQHLSQWMSPQTHFIGITAAYRNIDVSDWRQVVAIDPGSKTVKIQINLQSQSLIAKTV